MKKITKEELNEILLKHTKWLNGEEDGERADLSDANLRKTDLYGADLSGAKLRKTDLYGADLSGAKLSYANLSGADLYNTNLSDADLYNANLSGAKLSYANLSGADLYNTNLSDAKLSDANLSGADLSGANLYNANLDVKEMKRLGYIVEKPFIAYKKDNKNEIITLEILKGSIVFSINNNKCRTNRAKVIAINGDTTLGLKAYSNYDSNFIYEVGKIVEVKDFDLRYNVECAKGIHFFKTIEEAQEYIY